MLTNGYTAALSYTALFPTSRTAKLSPELTYIYQATGNML